MPITDIIEKLQRDRFFGSIEFKMEAGRVVLIRKTENIKPEQILSDQQRKPCAGSNI